MIELVKDDSAALAVAQGTLVLKAETVADNHAHRVVVLRTAAGEEELARAHMNGLGADDLLRLALAVVQAR